MKRVTDRSKMVTAAAESDEKMILHPCVTQGCIFMQSGRGVPSWKQMT